MKLYFSCFPSYPWYYHLCQARLSVIQKLSPVSLFPTFFQGRCIRSVSNFRVAVRWKWQQEGSSTWRNFISSKKIQKRMWRAKDWLHRNPGIRKEDSVKEGMGDLLHGNTENGSVGQQNWRWAVLEEDEEGNPLDETESEDRGQMAHRQLKE